MALSLPLSVPVPVSFLAVALAGYLFGAIPTSFIVGKLCFHLDLRQHGSGNLGATNAFRVLGPTAGLAVALIDVAKGALPVLAAHSLLPLPAAAGVSPQLRGWLMLIAGLAAITGHAFSPYIGFHGGKSIATSAGVMLAMVPLVFAIELACFLAVVAVTRYVSVGSLTVAILFPVWTFSLRKPLPFSLFAIAAAVLVVWLHRANIERLRQGTEPKFSFHRGGKQ
jgi:glycerol-3-phosphate acyltransferase PlsY